MENKKHIFSEVERNVFMDILKKYLHIVGCKKTDGQSLQQKNAAWDEIANIYNESPHASYKATSKQLRRLWMNLKQRKREKFTAERHYRLSNGDSFYMSDAIDPDMIQLTQNLFVNGEESEDSDTESEMVTEDAVKLSPSSPGVNTQTQAQPHATVPKSNGSKKIDILQREYNDRKRRADELHAMQMELMNIKIRKATAEAVLAELILNTKKSAS